MQKSIPHYLKYSFHLLFSKQFGNIVGSSLFLTFFVTIVSSISLLGYGYSMYFLVSRNTSSGDIWISGFLGFLILLLLLSLLAILLRGWLAIVIPIRSIDDTKHMDIRSDWKLYRKYIGEYFAYIFWYTLIIIATFFLYFFFLILTSAWDFRLGWISGIGGAVVILYVFTRLYLSWYHMLSEGSGKMKVFIEGVQITKGKVWKMFWKVLGFSLVVWIGSALIESVLMQMLSFIGFLDFSNHVAHIIDIQKNNILSLIRELGFLLSENTLTVFFSCIVFGAFSSLSSVLGHAMFHIFYVRYYLDMREEHDLEHSFIMPILRKSEHHH